MKDRDLPASLSEHRSAEFLRVSDLYGWKLYQLLLERTSDKQLLEELYAECLEAFCKENPGGSNEEAHLMKTAELVCTARLQSQRREPEEPKQWRHRGYVISIFLLLALIALCLWIIAGLLMELGILPYVNLGYPWL